MPNKEPRGTEVAFSTSQLDDAGIDDTIDDTALSDIVDDFFLTFSREFRAHVEQWKEDHPDER